MSLIDFTAKDAVSPKVSIEKITPQKAAEYLRANTQNRRLSNGHVSILAHDMKAGAWEVNGDAIRFDTNGVLIDGQHRLNAIVKAGVTIECFVIQGLSPESFATIDTNKVRGGADTLSVVGVEHHIQAASALRLVGISKLSDEWSGWTGMSGGKITNKDTLALLEEYPGVIDATKRIMSGDRKYCRKLLTPSVAVFAYYWMSLIDDGDAENFFEWLELCENLDRGHPVSLLRNRLIEIASAKHGRNGVGRRMMMALTFRAWNALRDGEEMKLLRWSTTTKFPTPH